MERLGLALVEWALSENIARSSVSKLLKILRDFNIEVPASSRTLCSTPRDLLVSQVGNGQYFYFGLEDQLKFSLQTIDQIPSVIRLQFNIDGAPCPFSSKLSFWPILARVSGLDISPFIVLPYTCRGKPSPHAILVTWLRQPCCLRHRPFVTTQQNASFRQL